MKLLLLACRTIQFHKEEMHKLTAVCAIIRRSISCTSCLQGRKSNKSPFDKRLLVSGKQVDKHVIGGTRELQEKVAIHHVQSTGYHNPHTNRYVHFKERIPEFIVPDLTEFELKPYVSYKAPDLQQTEFTAKDLFDACYAQGIKDGFKAGKILPLPSDKKDES